MEWYNYFSAFWAGAFVANFVPHFVNGISGNGFPTPFSKPRGKGLSSPLTNVLWALLNLALGYWLSRLGRVTERIDLPLVLFFIGLGTLSILLSRQFADKEKN